jgi:hypothetical protein
VAGFRSLGGGDESNGSQQRRTSRSGFIKLVRLRAVASRQIRHTPSPWVGLTSPHGGRSQ